jgi:hypothetical protein
MDHGELQAVFPEALEYDEAQGHHGASDITLRISPDVEQPTLIDERLDVRGNNLRYETNHKVEK